MSRNLGVQYERKALRILRKKGLVLLGSNFRCRHGEIDLVMRHHRCLVFVEVRYRAGSRFANAIESIDTHKQKKLIMTAAVYLSKHPRHANDAVRFDVVAFDRSEDRSYDKIRWIRDAFRP